MAKSSKTAQKEVKAAVKRMEKGTLKIGRSNKKVTDPRQAVAIGLSKATSKGAKASVKKNAPKKTAPKKAAVKKAAPKKAAAKKSAVKKAAAKKSNTPKKALKKAAVPKKSIKKSSSPNERIAKEQYQETAASKQRKTRSIPEDKQQENLPPVEEKSPVIVAAPPDPLWMNDEQLRAKAALRGNPGNKIRASSINRSRIKPSGKKPLWPG